MPLYGSSSSSLLRRSFSVLNKRSKKKGVMVSAVIQLKNSEKHSTQKREPTNSPVASGESPIGAKAVIAITVAPRRGKPFCDTTSFAA